MHLEKQSRPSKVRGFLQLQKCDDSSLCPVLSLIAYLSKLSFDCFSEGVIIWFYHNISNFSFTGWKSSCWFGLLVCQLCQPTQKGLYEDFGQMDVASFGWWWRWHQCLEESLGPECWGSRSPDPWLLSPGDLCSSWLEPRLSHLPTVLQPLFLILQIKLIKLCTLYFVL